MVGQSRLNNQLKGYWRKKLQAESDLVEQILQIGLVPVDCDRSPMELVAACSFLTAKKPIHEVLESVERYSYECAAPSLDEAFFEELHATLHGLELAGLRSHARKLRKVGQAIAGLRGANDWQEQWSRERKRKLESAIKDEPFYPQQG